MTNTAVQKEAFLLAGLLSNVMVQNLSKPDNRSYFDSFAGGSDEGFSDLTMRDADEFQDTLGGSFVPSTRGKFSDSIKKGSTVNATPLIYSASSLWQSTKSRIDYSLGFLLCSGRLVWFCAISTIARISAPVLMPISSILAKAIKASFRFDISLLSSLSFNWRRVISPCMAVTMKPALLSPSILTASIPSTTSWGIRALICCDLLFIELVDIAWFLKESAIQHTQKMNHTKELKWYSLVYIVNTTLSTGKAQAVHKIAKPGSALTLTGPLTQPLKQVTVMADKQHTQTRPKYQYRFLALNRADRTATPCRLSVEAETEREARQVLVRDFILVLAGRLPVKGVSHVA